LPARRVRGHAGRTGSWRVGYDHEDRVRSPEVTGYAYDGLHRLRRTTS